jgi:hypothetical protein
MERCLIPADRWPQRCLGEAAVFSFFRRLDMRTWALTMAAILAMAGLAEAGKVEVKGVHLCCPQCQKGVGAALSKVDGVANAKCDTTTKVVTFTAKDVHVCCKQCQNAIGDLFKDAKISYEGKGPQRDIKISGKGLEKTAVLETLQKAGFTGKVD